MRWAAGARPAAGVAGGTAAGVAFFFGIGVRLQLGPVIGGFLGDDDVVPGLSLKAYVTATTLRREVSATARPESNGNVEIATQSGGNGRT